MIDKRDIKYVGRDFTNFKDQLVEFAKNYFPDTYNDFSPTSPGMMLIEMAAYVGEVLSFYQDTQLQETFLTYAKDPKNLYSLAYMMGYRPKTTGISKAKLEITQIVEADVNYNPNWGQAAIIEANSGYTSTDSSRTKFLVDQKIDFTFSSSYDPTEVTIYSIENGNPNEFELKKTVEAYSAEVKTVTFNIPQAEKFKTLTIEDSNIVGILEITDSSDTWYEVPFLGQETVFIDTPTGDLNTPYALTLRKAPKRFVTRHLSSGYLQIQFGAGTNSNDDSIIIPDPTNVGLGSDPANSQLNKAYDPSNFLYSKSYGIAPTGTLTVKYLKGGGTSANVPANSITVSNSTNSISATSDSSRLSSTYLTFNNPTPAEGGRDGDTVEELRENSLRAFNEQSRAVTLQDYSVRVMSLPAKYGSIAKAFVTQDQRTNSNADLSSDLDSNPFAIGLYVLAYDLNKKLIPASTQLKQNIKTYLSDYIMVTDSVNLRDAFVVNIGINYEVIIRPNFSGRDVLLNCNNVLKDFFNISKWNINQPINLSDIYRALDLVSGVQTVHKVEIVNKQDSTGSTYSIYGYDIKGATRNNIVYPSFDPCIFEVKYPDQDINGRVTVL